MHSASWDHSQHISCTSDEQLLSNWHATLCWIPCGNQVRIQLIHESFMFWIISSWNFHLNPVWHHMASQNRGAALKYLMGPTSLKPNPRKSQKNDSWNMFAIPCILIAVSIYNLPLYAKFYYSFFLEWIELPRSWTMSSFKKRLRILFLGSKVMDLLNFQPVWLI